MKSSQLLPLIASWILLFIVLGLLIHGLWQIHSWYPEAPVSYLTPRQKKVVTLPKIDIQVPTVKGVSVVRLPAEKPIPILMYHYIRDYQDPNDKVGVNLSVRPAIFTRQLTLLRERGYTTITFDDLTQPLPEKPIILTFDDGYTDAYTAALPELERQGMKAVFYIVSQFIDQPNYVTTDQVKMLDAAGMEIGSHTLDHADLSKINAARQGSELKQSKEQLEELLGKPVTAFCYPAGKYNQTTIGLAKVIGYQTATTTKPGVAIGDDYNSRPFELQRIRVTNGIDLAKELKAR